jgi:hypothetical protein
MYRSICLQHKSILQLNTYPTFPQIIWSQEVSAGGVCRREASVAVGVDEAAAGCGKARNEGRDEVVKAVGVSEGSRRW